MNSGKLPLVKLACSSVLLAVFCFGADYTVFHWPPLQNNKHEMKLLRAVTDTLSHGVIAGWSCANVLLWQPGNNLSMSMVQVGMGVVIGSILDLDHFVEARSLKLEDAISLTKRPFAHNTTLLSFIVILVYCLLFLIPHLRNKYTQYLPLIILVSFLSHHLRDADRRGVWFGFFSTSPIPWKLYVAMVIAIPWLLRIPCVFSVLSLPHQSFNKTEIV